jgi:hypothetical protein
MPATDEERIHRSWTAVILEEYDRHPSMTIRDLHKLVYQGCFGGDHLLREPDAFALGLADEWDRLGPSGTTGAALQRVHPSGRVARLHLGPCKARGLSLRELTQQLLGQPLKQGHRDAFEWAWATVLHCARIGEIPFPYSELAQIQLSDEIGHHSPNYGFAAYRILNDAGHPSMREYLYQTGILR